MRLGVKIAIAFVLGLLIIGGVGVQCYLGIQQLTETNRLVTHTHEVKEDLERVISALKDAETGQRGFVLTGEDRYLEPYQSATGEIQKDIDLLVSLTQDNSEQLKSLQQLQKLSGDKLDELQETIKLRKESGLDAALPVIRSDRGRRSMDEIRGVVAQMEGREGDLLIARNKAASEVAQRTVLTLGCGVLLSLAVLGIAAVIVTRTMKLADRGLMAADAGRNWPRMAVRYASAVAVVALAMAVKSWLERLVGGPLPAFIIFYPGILLVAVVAGGGPGVLATLLSVLAADYWYFAPQGQFSISSPNEALALGIFCGSALLLSILAERIRRSRWAEAVTVTQEKELALLDMGNFMALDLEHRIVRWSEGNRRLYGFEASEARGQRTYEFLQTKFAAQSLEQIHAELADKGYWQGEVTRRTKDGAPLSVALLWALRRDERGKPLAILEVSADITGQKIAEESLRQQSEELAQQNEELSRQSEELTQQSEELSEQNEELQTQSEEIQSLNADLARREKTLQTLLDSARLPASEQEVMGKICHAAIEMFDPSAIGAVVCERNGDELRILAHAGFEGAPVPASWAVKGSFVEMVMRENRTASLEDTSLRPDLKILPVPGLRRFAAALAAPLRVKGQPVGAVTVYSDQTQPWTAEQFHFVEWLGAQCSNALDAMRLAAEVLQAQKQNEFLANIVETSSQAFGVGYLDGRLGLINKAFEQLTGYSGEELRSIDWAKMLTAPQWREIERKKLDELNRTGQPVRYEKEYIRKDGTIVPVELLVHLVRDAEGKPLYYYSFITDITARKRAEEALRASEELIRAVAEGTSDPIFVKDRQSRLLMANPATLGAMGKGAEEVIGKTDAELYADPEIGRAILETDRRIMDSGRAETVEEIIDTPAGRRVFLSSKTPRRDGAGRVIGLVGVSRDITDRKAAEEALAESRERLDLALTSAQMATFDWDIVKNKRIWSDGVHRLLGTSPEKFTGTAEEFLAVIDPQDRSAVQAALAKAVETGAPYESEYRAVWPDGSVHHIAAKGLVHRDDAGRPVRMTGICWDITERKAAEEELDRHRQHLEELVQERTAALRRSQALLEDTQRVTKVGGWEFDVATGRAFWTDEVYRIHGVPMDFVPGPYQSVDFYAPEDQKRIADAFGLAVARGEPYDLELQLVTAKGKRIWVRTMGQAEQRDGRVVRVFGNIMDITERKRAEEALRMSEQEFRSLAEAMPQIVWATRPDGWNVYFNQRWVDYTGMTMEASHGHGWNAPFHPDDKQRAWESWQNATQHNAPYSLECRLRRADGEYRWWLIRGVPMLGANGEILKWFGTCTDIEELKRAEAALQEANDQLERRVAERTAALAESEERFRTMTNSIPQLAWVAKADGYIYWYNQRWYEYTGTTPQEMEGWGWQSVHDPDVLPRVMAQWQASIATGAPFDMEFPLRGADGKFRPFLTRIMPVKDAQGRLVQWFGTNTDISERAAVEEALRRTVDELARSNKELEQFAYVSSHDLQEPLRMVSAFLNLLQDRYGPKLDDTARQYIGFSVEGATRMANLIKDLLAYSRVGRKDTKMERVDGNRPLAAALANLRAAVTEAGATITHDNLPGLTGNESQLTQLFQNLIGNAVKFRSPQRPCQVHIGAQQQNGKWVFTVRDNGIGIEPAYHEKVFHIFQRLHGRDQYAGTGIGLAICKKIVEQHGGKIWIESKADEGSAFCFTLPRENSHE